MGFGNIVYDVELPDKRNRLYVECPKCNYKIRRQRLNRHLEKQHGVILKRI